MVDVYKRHLSLMLYSVCCKGECTVLELERAHRENPTPNQDFDPDELEELQEFPDDDED